MKSLPFIVGKVTIFTITAVDFERIMIQRCFLKDAYSNVVFGLRQQEDVIGISNCFYTRLLIYSKVKKW